MGILICNKHGESGLIPTISRELSHGMKQGSVKAEDIGIAHVQLFEQGEVLDEKIYFFHKGLDDLNSYYLINSEESDREFSKKISEVYRGGGYCVYCFREYMRNIGFNLDELPAPSGITL